MYDLCLLIDMVVLYPQSDSLSDLIFHHFVFRIFWAGLKSWLNDALEPPQLDHGPTVTVAI